MARMGSWADPVARSRLGRFVRAARGRSAEQVVSIRGAVTVAGAATRDTPPRSARTDCQGRAPTQATAGRERPRTKATGTRLGLIAASRAAPPLRARAEQVAGQPAWFLPAVMPLRLGRRERRVRMGAVAAAAVAAAVARRAATAME